MSLEIVPNSEVARKAITSLRKATRNLAEAQIALIDAVTALEMFATNFEIEEKKGSLPDSSTLYP